MSSLRPSSTMPDGSHDARAGLRRGQVGIDGLQAHLGLERAHQELAHGDGLAVEEERPHAEIGVHAAHVRGVHLAVARAVIVP